MSTLNYELMQKTMAEFEKRIRPDNFDTVVSHAQNLSSLHGISGINVVSNPNLTVPKQIRFPKCNKKKTRITKKFVKKYTIQVPDNNVYLIDTSKLYFDYKVDFKSTNDASYQNFTRIYKVRVECPTIVYRLMK